MILNKDYVIELLQLKKLNPQEYRFLIYLLSIAFEDTKRIKNKKRKEISSELNINPRQITESNQKLTKYDIIQNIENDRYLNLKLFTDKSILLEENFVIKLIKENKLKTQDYRIIFYMLAITDDNTSKKIKNIKGKDMSVESGIQATQISVSIKRLKENEVIYIKNSEKFFNENLFRDDPF